jgi:hypothetical protein
MANGLHSISLIADATHVEQVYSLELVAQYC